MSTNKEVLGKFYQALATFWSTGNADIFDTVIAADCVNHMAGFPPTLEGLKQALPAFRQGFPDMQVTEFESWEDNGTVADRVVWTATHTGDFMGIPATGKQIKVSEIHINRFANGKLAERWGNWDQMGMMQQLGVIPQQ